MLGSSPKTGGGEGSGKSRFGSLSVQTLSHRSLQTRTTSLTVYDTSTLATNNHVRIKGGN